MLTEPPVAALLLVVCGRGGRFGLDREPVSMPVRGRGGGEGHCHPV